VPPFARPFRAPRHGTIHIGVHKWFFSRLRSGRGSQQSAQEVGVPNEPFCANAIVRSSIRLSSRSVRLNFMRILLACAFVPLHIRLFSFYSFVRSFEQTSDRTKCNENI